MRSFLLNHIFICSFWLTSQAYGQMEPRPALSHDLFDWVASYGFSFGGADAVKSQYNPYQDNFETTGLASLSAGGDFKVKNSKLSLQVLASVYFDSAEAGNGDANLDYHTIDILSFYDLGKHRFGIGISQHLNPSFTINDSQAEQVTHFKNTLGTLAEYNYLYDKKTAVGLRFTNIDYEPLHNSQDQTVNGENISLFIKTFY